MLSFGLPLVSRAQVAAAAAVDNAIRVSYSICITVSGKSIVFSVTCTPVSVVHSPHTPGTMSGTLPVRFRPTPSRFSRGMQELCSPPWCHMENALCSSENFHLCRSVWLWLQHKFDVSSSQCSMLRSGLWSVCRQESQHLLYLQLVNIWAGIRTSVSPTRIQ